MLERGTQNKTLDIAIIGLGWYGVQCALSLSQNSKYNVTVFEKKSSPCSGKSSTLGVGLHIGPHYPRSPETRENCRQGRQEFQATYPELVNQHSHSYYGIGKQDADGNPSKVTSEKFRRVCTEVTTPGFREVPIPTSDFSSELESVFDIPEEASLAVGPRLRNYLQERLNQSRVTIHYNSRICKIIPKDERHQIIGTTSRDIFITTQLVLMFDRVINATSFKAHLPRSLPNPLTVIYQVCLALVYKSVSPSEQLKSFFIMDGLFPRFMPYDIRETDAEKTQHYYMLTHAKYTNMMSSDNLDEAEIFLEDEMPALLSKVRQLSEADIQRYWPKFSLEFTYQGHKAAILAKPSAETEFKSSITFEQDGVIHILPGKVSDIFQTAREVESLILNNPNSILVDGTFRYVKGGVLHKDKTEALIAGFFKPGPRFSNREKQRAQIIRSSTSCPNLFAESTQSNLAPK